jgi:hypothetical protein
VIGIGRQFLTGLRPTTNDENFGVEPGLGKQRFARIFRREGRSPEVRIRSVPTEGVPAPVGRKSQGKSQNEQVR